MTGRAGTTAAGVLELEWVGALPPPGLSVCASPLVRRPGQEIPASRVRIGPAAFPPLWELSTLLGTDVPARATRAEVRVEVPPDAWAGDYAGVLRVDTGSAAVEARLTLRVLPRRADRVVLIRGALNQSDFRDLQKALRRLGFAPRDILEWRNLEHGLNSTATENARALLAALKRRGWRPHDVVDVVGHSFGGLVARRLAQMNAEPGRRVVALRNIITCGTPLGGHNGAGLGAWARLRFGSTELVKQQMKTLSDLASAAAHPRLYEDVRPRSPEGTPRYWLLGGTDNTRSLIPLRGLYLDLGELEPYPKDGVVSTRSVAGYSPKRRWVKQGWRLYLEPVVRDPHDRDTDEGRRIRFLCLRHDELILDLSERGRGRNARNPVHDFILPLVQGWDWPPAGAGAQAAGRAPAREGTARLPR